MLHLSGEQVYPGEPLPLDAAVALFQARAQEAGVRLGRGVEDQRAIERICEHVDRLPLAVELAAGRTRILSPAELLDRLEARLPLLTDGPRDLPARQQTIRATIEWSYGLLETAERRALARIGVFVDGFTLDAADTSAGPRSDSWPRLPTTIWWPMLRPRAVLGTGCWRRSGNSRSNVWMTTGRTKHATHTPSTSWLWPRRPSLSYGESVSRLPGTGS